MGSTLDILKSLPETLPYNPKKQYIIDHSGMVNKLTYHVTRTSNRYKEIVTNWVLGTCSRFHCCSDGSRDYTTCNPHKVSAQAIRR